MAYAVIARYTCDPADADEIRERLSIMRTHTLEEPGSLMYELHDEVGDQPVFIIYEQYVDRAGFEAHTVTAHFEEHVNGFIKPKLVDRSVFFATTFY